MKSLNRPLIYVMTLMNKVKARPNSKTTHQSIPAIIVWLVPLFTKIALCLFIIKLLGHCIGGNFNFHISWIGSTISSAQKGRSGNIYELGKS